MQLKLVIKNDNLILYDITNQTIWNTPEQQNFKGDSTLVLDDNGILNLFNKHRQVRKLLASNLIHVLFNTTSVNTATRTYTE